MCLSEAPDDIVRRYVTHAFADGYKKVAWLRFLVKLSTLSRQYN